MLYKKKHTTVMPKNQEIFLCELDKLIKNFPYDNPTLSKKKKRKIIKLINSRYKLMADNDLTVLDEFISEKGNKYRFELRPIKVFKGILSGYKIKIGENNNNVSRYLEVADLWLESKLHEIYFQGYIFDPSLKYKYKHAFNLYKGLAINPSQRDWSLLKELMFENFCNKNQYYYEWLLDWVYVLLKTPWEQQYRAAIVLSGAQNTGKNTFANFLRDILYPHYQATSDLKKAFKYNAFLENSLLVYLNEIKWENNEYKGMLKSYISDDQILYEDKYKKVHLGDNYMRFIISSNDNWIINADPDDTRFFILKIDQKNKYANNQNFFSRLYKQMYQDGGLEGFLHYILYEHKLKHSLHKIPKTKALSQQIRRSLSTFNLWLLEIAESGEIDKDIIITDNFKMQKDDLYEHYKIFCKNINKTPKSKGGWKIVMTEFIKKGGNCKLVRINNKEENGNFYVFSLKDLRKDIKKNFPSMIHDWEKPNNIEQLDELQKS